MALLPKRKPAPTPTRRKAGSAQPIVETPAQPMVESKGSEALPKYHKIGTIPELINRRRRQILVHSVIYYRFNRNIIEDYIFDKWSKELADLQRTYPEVAAEAVFAEEFKDFDGCTGMQFIDHPWGIRKAEYLLAITSRKGGD